MTSFTQVMPWAFKLCLAKVTAPSLLYMTVAYVYTVNRCCLERLHGWVFWQLLRALCITVNAYSFTNAVFFLGKRPFGVSILYMGWDKHYNYQLYQSDPSGNYGGWKATCIGNNSSVGNWSHVVKNSIFPLPIEILLSWFSLLKEI